MSELDDVERFNLPLAYIGDLGLSCDVVFSSRYDALAADLVAARAEIERLTKERDDAVHWRDHYQRQLSAEKLSFQRRAAGLWQPIYDKARGDAEKAEAERDDARSTLADAERDMRQRAADLFADANHGEHIKSAILALPLKHADREEGK